MKKTKFLVLAVSLLIICIISGCGSTDYGGTGNTGSMKIVNNSVYAVNYVYLTPTSTTFWGFDLLGVLNTISAGDSFTINNIPPGLYDSKIVLSNGSPWYKYNVQITAGSIYTITVPSTANKVVGKVTPSSKAEVLMDGGIKELVSPESVIE